MLHVPVNTILAAPAAHRAALELPAPIADDWAVLRVLEEAALPEFPSLLLAATAIQSAREQVRRLSFYRFLEDRLLAEAALYRQHGFHALMIENVAGPYFVRGGQPAVLYWVMQALAERLRGEHPGVPIGIQVLAYSDDWAMDIACRSGLDFVRCESALFEGLRPEGRAPNRGNLAKLYMARQQLLANLGEDHTEPQVYVDLHKKHTVFSGGLEPLDPWLENILFQKLEGIIITGKATGSEVAEADLRQAREAVEKVKAQTSATLGRAWAPPLLVGSGVTSENLSLCARYADGVIVGSSLKQGGYWENPLDEERVEKLAEAWSHL